MRKIFKKEFGFNIKYIMLILFVLVGSMTIGYSALKQTLYIKGEVKIEKRHVSKQFTLHTCRFCFLQN